MNKTKIEWADMTWNPLTGCFHGCPYCYARGIARRFASKDPEAILETATRGGKVAILEKPYVYDGKIELYPYGFNPTFHLYRLSILEQIKNPQRIFVCSMADLFGDWVPDWVILSVFESCRRAPQHQYLFLTKNPARYGKLIQEHEIKESDVNFWLGSTFTGPDSRFYEDIDHHSFISFEPILEPWPPASQGNPYRVPDWVILGAETGNRKGKVVPEKGWIDNIVAKCRRMKSAVFMKDSLIPIVGEENMIREFPRGLCL